MKYLIFPMFFLFSSSIIWAQTEKGNYFLGTSSNVTGGSTTTGPGSVGFAFGTYKSSPVSGNNTITTEQKTTAFNFSPVAGYFVAKGLVIGAGIRYGSFRSNDDTDDDSKSSSISAGPFVRYYLNAGKKVQPFAQAHGGLYRAKYKSEFTSVLGQEELKSNDKGTTAGLQLGAAFFIGQRTSLDLYADYNYNRYNSESDFFDETSEVKNTQKVFGVGIGLTFLL